MTARTIHSPDPNAMVRRLSSPLPATQFVAVTAAGVLIGAIYCQVWCLVAFPPANRMMMPIEASIAWSLSTVAPWVAAFEVGKRRSEFARAWTSQLLVIAIAFGLAAFISVVAEVGLDRFITAHRTRPLPLQFASQIPAIAITALAIAASAFAQRTGVEREDMPSDALAALVARSAEIEWIDAAGNYAEVHSAGGSSLHRVTMRDLEQALDPAKFVRIHRSTIVNPAYIASRVAIGGSPGVRLRDGTLLKIGSRYAGSLGRQDA